VTRDLTRLASFEPLRQQLLAAARAFAGDARPLGDLLAALVDDVERAAAEPLEVFPVCHHSPAAALHMVRRLTRQPRVIFIELCEDLRPVVDKLRDCKLPVALQAFAGQSDAFPRSWTPLSVVAPLTEFSAEYQAIAFALEHPQTDLVFVDRSVDHVFQWLPQEEGELERHLGKDEEQDAAGGGEPAPPMHGAAVGVQVGEVEPTFEQFHTFLLQNARVRSFAEWWDQYVEQAVIGSDYATYRQVLFLVGSLLRRLGRKQPDHEEDRRRERFMWTRMKDSLAGKQVEPGDALYVCGAVHAVSDVEEFGTARPARWEIPPRTATKWLYGLIPSSHAAIDRQFRLPPGTVTLDEATWDKSRRALGVRPFTLAQAGAKAGAKAKKAPAKARQPPEAVEAPEAPAAAPPPAAESLLQYLTRPPALAGADEEQLLGWCVGIVDLARRNGYLASTADSIAVYHTAVLLAQVRNRPHPTAYDFRDAAVTCLEKDRTPRKRNVERLCDVLLGGDRIGQVGFSSLPPLAQDVYERLAPLGINLKATSIQRALLDLRQRPDLLPCSDLLWKLRYLLEGQVVRPIMGERALGQTPAQESWDVAIGKYQTPLIQLGYEGVTAEHVLEKRLKAKAFAAEATPAAALQAAEDAVLYLKSARLTEEVGEHAVDLLVQETGAQSAPEIFERVRRLVHYFRSTPEGLPEWLKRLVTTGYAHYSTLLPAAFADRGTTPAQVAAMLAFVFNLESLALSLGCSRSQLVIAVQQSGPVTEDPNKLGLLWAAEWLLALRRVEDIRAFFDGLLENRLALASFPAYVNGFLLALQFTPLVARLVVELLSRAFERLPDDVLLPWLPGLILTLRPHAGSVLPNLLKEASACFPAALADLGRWQPPWEAPAAPAAPAAQPAAALSPAEAAVRALLASAPACTNALAALLGQEPVWRASPQGEAAATPTPGEPSGVESSVQGLLLRHPAAAGPGRVPRLAGPRGRGRVFGRVPGAFSDRAPSGRG
jgi:hypothetical protein